MNKIRVQVYFSSNSKIFFSLVHLSICLSNILHFIFVHESYAKYLHTDILLDCLTSPMGKGNMTSLFNCFEISCNISETYFRSVPNWVNFLVISPNKSRCLSPKIVSICIGKLYVIRIDLLETEARLIRVHL
jgi:hypothetical protein